MTDPRPIQSAAGIPTGERPMASPQQVRIFVGLKMAPEIAEQLALLARRIERAPVRFVPAGDIHLTLLPPWNEASVPEAVEKLRRAVNGIGHFSLTFERLCMRCATLCRGMKLVILACNFRCIARPLF
jgi:hypothetical protein